MTDREALLALTAPEPEYSGNPSGWQQWHDRYNEAIEHAAHVRNGTIPSWGGPGPGRELLTGDGRKLC